MDFANFGREVLARAQRQPVSLSCFFEDELDPIISLGRIANAAGIENRIGAGTFFIQPKCGFLAIGPGYKESGRGLAKLRRTVLIQPEAGPWNRSAHEFTTHDM